MTMNTILLIALIIISCSIFLALIILLCILYKKDERETELKKELEYLKEDRKHLFDAFTQCKAEIKEICDLFPDVAEYRKEKEENWLSKFFGNDNETKND